MNFVFDEKKSTPLCEIMGRNKSDKGSININNIIYPLLAELFGEMEKTILLSKERYGISIKHIYLMNNDYKIGWLIESVQNKLMLPTQTIPLSTVLIPNQISQTFSQTLSSTLAVIATQIR